MRLISLSLSVSLLSSFSMSFRTSAVGGPEEAAGGRQRGPCSLFGKGEDPARLAGERKRYMKAKLAHVVQRLSHVVCTTRGSAGSPRSSAFVHVRLFSGRPELSSLPSRESVRSSPEEVVEQVFAGGSSSTWRTSRESREARRGDGRT